MANDVYAIVKLLSGPSEWFGPGENEGEVVFVGSEGECNSELARLNRIRDDQAAYSDRGGIGYYYRMRKGTFRLS